MKIFIIFFILVSFLTLFSIGNRVYAQGKNPHDVVLVQCGYFPDGKIPTVRISTSENSPTGICTPFIPDPGLDPITPCAECLAKYLDKGFVIMNTTSFTSDFVDALHTLVR